MNIGITQRRGVKRYTPADSLRPLDFIHEITIGGIARDHPLFGRLIGRVNIYQIGIRLTGCQNQAGAGGACRMTADIAAAAIVEYRLNIRCKGWVSFDTTAATASEGGVAVAASP